MELLNKMNFVGYLFESQRTLETAPLKLLPQYSNIILGSSNNFTVITKKNIIKEPITKINNFLIYEW